MSVHRDPAHLGFHLVETWQDGQRWSYTQDFMPGQLEDKWQWGTKTLEGKHGQ